MVAIVLLVLLMAAPVLADDSPGCDLQLRETMMQAYNLDETRDEMERKLASAQVQLYLQKETIQKQANELTQLKQALALIKEQMSKQ